MGTSGADSLTEDSLSKISPADTSGGVAGVSGVNQAFNASTKAPGDTGLLT